MDVANEILDAIEIIVDKKIRENTVQIYPGVCKSVSGNSCVMSINGRDNTVQFYGSTPTVGTIYRVFVPNSNMSMAFIIAINDDSSSAKSASIFVTGLSKTDTVTAVHKTIVKYPNPDTRGLPDGYTELEYIEGTGTQYINTGLPLNSSYIMTKSVSIGYGYIYGVDNYTSGIGNCNLTTDGSYVNVGWGTAWVSMQKASYNTTEKTSITRISDGSSTNFTVNGVSYSAGSSGYRSNPSSFYVFARNNSASGAPSGEATTDLKLYSLSFYTSPDTCVRDFVPAKRNSDGEFGLYDLVNKVFYTNAGTGTFTAGAEVSQYIDGYADGKTIAGKLIQNPNPAYVVPDGYTQLEYIQSSGTQYIDTGVKPNQNIGLSLDVAFFGSAGGNIAGVRNTRNDDTNRFGVVTWSSGTMGTYFGKSAIQAIPLDADKHTYQVDKNQVIIDGKNYGATNGGNFTCNYNFLLFAWNNGQDGIDKKSSNVFSCKLYENDDIVRDFIPAKRNFDGAIGLYDLVSASFFENAGTGTFTAGAEVPQTIDGFLIDKIKDYGTWTITATDGTNTATQDVLVDSAMQYEIEMSYTL